MQSQENGQKPQFGIFIDDLDVKVLKIAKFFWEKGFIQIEGHV